MMVVWTGRPGAGKSYFLGQTSIDILYRNRAWYEKTGIKRPLKSNLAFNPEIEAEFTSRDPRVGSFIEYWVDPMQVVRARDCDVAWDEIASHLDSARWADTPAEMKRWLQQHRKFGVEIYATAQDFAQVDIAAKRVVSNLIYIIKIAGSGDPSPTKPPVKYIWGVNITYDIDPATYDEKKSKIMLSGFPSFHLITREGVEVFNTRQEIKGTEFPALHHINQVCEREDCTFHRIRHV